MRSEIAAAAVAGFAAVKLRALVRILVRRHRGVLRMDHTSAQGGIRGESAAADGEGTALRLSANRRRRGVARRIAGDAEEVTKAVRSVRQRGLKAAAAHHATHARGFVRDAEVMHEDETLVRVQEPVAPTLEPIVLGGVRVVAVEELDVANLELLVRLAHRLTVFLFLPVVAVLAEEADSLSVEEVERAGCAEGRGGRKTIIRPAGGAGWSA